MAQLCVRQFVFVLYIHAIDRNQALSDAVNSFHLFNVHFTASKRARFDHFEAFCVTVGLEVVIFVMDLGRSKPCQGHRERPKY